MYTYIFWSFIVYNNPNVYAYDTFQPYRGWRRKRLLFFCAYCHTLYSLFCVFPHLYVIDYQLPRNISIVFALLVRRRWSSTALIDIILKIWNYRLQVSRPFVKYAYVNVDVECSLNTIKKYCKIVPCNIQM